MGVQSPHDMAIQVHTIPIWETQNAIPKPLSERVQNPYQYAHQRDRNPIAEVDFNANHLRMFLAFNKTDVIGDHDAYPPIVYESGVYRDKVKAFINSRLNNESFEATRDVVARSKPYIGHTESKKIADAFDTLYPKLNLHYSFALVAMQLEGLIQRNLLLRGAQHWDIGFTNTQCRRSEFW